MGYSLATIRSLSILCMALCTLTLPVEALAQAAENNLTSGMMNNYKNVMQTVATNIGTIAATTFWALASIELVYSLGMKAIAGGDPGDILKSFLKRLLFIGFWGWMLTNAKANIDLLIATMVDLASRGVTPITWTPSLTTPLVPNSPGAVLNPDNIIDQGIIIVKETIDILPGGIGEIPTAIAMLVAAVFVFISLMIIAAYMALALLEMYIVGYGGVFLLALGPNRHTTGYAQAYLRFLMSAGIKIFAIALIAAIAEIVMSAQIAAMVNENAGQIWATVAMAGILAILASKAPSAASGAIQGISSSSAPISAGGLIKGATIAAASAIGMGAAAGAAAGAGASAGTSSGAAAREGGAGVGMSAARALGGGIAGAASAIGGAAADEVKEAIGGRSGSNPFPRGGTAGGRMAARIAEKSKSSK